MYGAFLVNRVLAQHDLLLLSSLSRFLFLGSTRAASILPSRPHISIVARSSSLSIDSRARGRQRDPLGPPPGRRRRFHFREIRFGAAAIAASVSGATPLGPPGRRFANFFSEQFFFEIFRFWGERWSSGVRGGASKRGGWRGQEAERGNLGTAPSWWLGPHRQSTSNNERAVFRRP